MAEHPARMELDTRMAALQWAPSYKRATLMQAPLALVSLIAGVGVWLMSSDERWLIGALLVGVVVPFRSADSGARSPETIGPETP